MFLGGKASLPPQNCGGHGSGRIGGKGSKYDQNTLLEILKELIKKEKEKGGHLDGSNLIM